MGAGRRRRPAGAAAAAAAGRAHRGSLRRSRRQDGAARGRGRRRHWPSTARRSASSAFEENLAPARPRGRDPRRRRRDPRRDPLRRGPARRPLLGDRHDPPPSGRRLDQGTRGLWRSSPDLQSAASRCRRPSASSGRAPRLLHLLARTRGGRAAGGCLPRPPCGLRARPRSRRTRSAFRTSSRRRATCGPCRATFPCPIRARSGLDGFFAARFLRRT